MKKVYALADDLSEFISLYPYTISDSWDIIYSSVEKKLNPEYGPTKFKSFSTWDGENILVCGSDNGNGILLSSDNAAESWKKVDLPGDFMELNTIHHINEQNVLITGKF